MERQALPEARREKNEAFLMLMPSVPFAMRSMSSKHIIKALIEDAEEAMPEECGKVLRLLT